MYPVFLVIALLLAGVTALLMWRLDKQDNDLAFLLNLVLLLLVYPATLMHYSVMLIAPLFWLWSQRERLPGGIIGYAVLVGILYTIVEIGFGDVAFAANLLIWLVLSGVAFQRILGLGVARSVAAPAPAPTT
jgi:hypothetical protein